MTERWMQHLPQPGGSKRPLKRFPHEVVGLQVSQLSTYRHLLEVMRGAFQRVEILEKARHIFPSPQDLFRVKK